MKCFKRKMDKVKAMLIVAKSISTSNQNHNRREIRFYFCNICNSYHTTSQNFNKGSLWTSTIKNFQG